MGWGAGKKLFPLLDNVQRVIAIEVLCAVQGIEYRRPLEPAPGTRRIMELVRSHVPPLDRDRSLADEIEVISNLIGRGELKAES